MAPKIEVEENIRPIYIENLSSLSELDVQPAIAKRTSILTVYVDFPRNLGL